MQIQKLRVISAWRRGNIQRRQFWVSVRGREVKMRPWAQIIRGRGKTKNIQIHSAAQTHQGTFPQTDTDLVSAAGIGINTSSISREELKGKDFLVVIEGGQVKKFKDSTDALLLRNLQTQIFQQSVQRINSFIYFYN